MESALSIAPAYSLEAAVSKVSPERRPSGRVLEFPAPEWRHFAARNKIFTEGDVAGEVFQITQGAVMIVRSLSEGRRQILDIAGPGRFIGLTGGRVHDCTAVALRDASVLCHERCRLRNAFHGVDFTAVMFDEIQRLRDLATALGRKTALERLAGFMLALFDEGADGAAPVEVILPVSRQEIADHLGLVIETVCRNLTQLKRRGLIRTDGNYGLVILDPAGLRQIAEGAATPNEASR